MAAFLVLVALAAVVVALISLGKKRWRPAGIAGVIFILALIIHAHMNHGAAQQATTGNFPIPLNSGAGAAGTIPK
ncbi:MAG: hypothetical protein ACREMP_02955 [Candidatus Tyrphobacter sp.]